AWGTINTPEQWKTLNKIKNSYYSVAFRTKILAKNIAKPLLNYINLHFVNQTNKEKSKLLIMFGHDSNIASVMSALDFAPYQLHVDAWFHRYKIEPVHFATNVECN
ncbi:MAG: histidine-type phosphatase, partial [Arsenophonus sp. NC-QC1-MAG3]